MTNDNRDDTTPPWAEPFPLNSAAYQPCPLSVTDSRHLVDRCVLDKAIALLARLDSAHPASAEFAQACVASRQFRQQHGENERLLRGDV